MCTAPAEYAGPPGMWGSSTRQPPRCMAATQRHSPPVCDEVLCQLRDLLRVERGWRAVDGPVVRRQALSVDACSTQQAAQHAVSVMQSHRLCCRMHSMAQHTSTAHHEGLLRSTHNRATEPSLSVKSYLLWPGCPNRPACSGLMPGSPAAPAGQHKHSSSRRADFHSTHA
jgi:hypothetical protein